MNVSALPRTHTREWKRDGKRETGSWGSIGVPSGILGTEAVTPFPFRFDFLYTGRTVLLKYFKSS